MLGSKGFSVYQGSFSAERAYITVLFMVIGFGL